MLPPERIVAGRYRLGRLLGEGGMGAVYEAEHVGLGATVAVKLLTDRFVDDPDAVERFRREARAAAAVRHPNVVNVTDTGTDEEGAPFLVMELLVGESLGSVLKRRRRLPPEVAVAIACEVLAGLGAAHARGIVHRDLKPGNVFLAVDPDGVQRVKLLDFGISKFLGAASELTSEGAIIGTPHYMPPEQIRGRRDLDARVDLYAVGVLLYRMLSGRLPFEGASPQQLYEAIVVGRRKPLRALCPELPTALTDVVERALHPEPSKRFQRAEEMIAALRAALPEAPQVLPLLTPRARAETPSHSGLRPGAVAGGAEPQRDPSTTSDPADVSTAPTWHAGGTPPVSPPAVPVEASSPRAGPAAPPTTAEPGASNRAKRWYLLAASVALAILGGWLLGRGGREGPSADATAGSGAAGDSTGAAVAGGPERPAGPAITFFAVRYADRQAVLRDLRPLARYLTERLGRRVELQVLESHAPLEKRLAERPALAALSAYKYVQAEQRVPGVRLLVTAVRRGGPWYQGLVLARPEAQVSRLEDLRGKVFCYVDERSTSGYLYPRALLRRAGLDPDADFRATRFTGDHLASLRALQHGACDAAAVYANALYKEAERIGIDPGSFVVLAQTGRIPYDAYVASPRLAPPLAQAIRAALLELRPGSELAERVFGAESDLRGFVSAHVGTYEAVRRLARHMEGAGAEKADAGQSASASAPTTKTSSPARRGASGGSP